MLRKAWVMGWSLAMGCSHPAPAQSTVQPPTDQERAEDAIGQVFGQIIMSPMGKVRDPALTKYVEGVGGRVVAAAGLSKRRWWFEVLDSAHANAFALPGGRVYITRGAIAALHNEAQLAGVLAHEVGHIAAHHSLSTIQVNAVKVQTSEDRTEQKEAQADQLAVGYLIRAGYDPRAFPEALRSLDAQEPSCSAVSPARIAKLWRRINAVASGELGRDRHLRRIDGMVVGHDPRSGRVEGNRFVSENRGLALSFPSDFQVEMEEVAVRARHPSGHPTILMMHLGPGIARSTFGARISHPTTLHAAGIRAQIGRVTDETDDWLAVVDTPLDAFWMTCTEGGPRDRCERLLTSVIQTSTVPVVTPGLTVKRLRIASAPRAGRWIDVVKQACGPNADIGEIARFNDAKSNATLAAGDPIKCVVKGM